MEKEQYPYPDEEISLVDIIRFFARQGKLILFTTLGLTALAVAYTLIQQSAPSYQKELTLTVEPTAIPFSGNSGVSLPTYSNSSQANTAAIEFLNTQETETVDLNAVYEEETGEVILTLQSPTPEPLPTQSEQVLEQLQQDLQTALKKDILRNLAQLETRLSREQAILREIEAEIAQTPPVEANVDNPRLSSLESQRTRQLALLADLEFDQNYLQEALTDLEDFTQQVYSIEIEEESEIQQQSSRSPLQVGILAFIAGFMVSVLIAIIQEQIPQIRAELAKSTAEKPENDRPTG
ncbi:MAG: hypothetical protein F6K03_06830 [Kamptonema sp. SIO4C4]|nr:hypothetical protein [Kamptonema sp. SIO4C4]